MSKTAASSKNLHVDGTINTGYKYAAGLIGLQYGEVSIENCRSSIVINSSVEGDGTHGGFVALSGDRDMTELTIEGSVFDGKLLSVGNTATTCCAGFVGYTSRAVTFNNCVYAPAEPSDEETWVSSDHSAAFARFGNEPVITTCWYIEPFDDDVHFTDQGVKAFPHIRRRSRNARFR